MQFNDGELKMMRWLREQHASWRTTRAIILTGSILTIVCGICVMFVIGFDLAIAILLVLAAGGLSYTLGSWSGRPEISLLLKLLEAQVADTERDNQA